MELKNSEMEALKQRLDELLRELSEWKETVSKTNQLNSALTEKLETEQRMAETNQKQLGEEHSKALANKEDKIEALQKELDEKRDELEH
jgi:uncharacterized protein YukE